MLNGPKRREAKPPEDRFCGLRRDLGAIAIQRSCTAHAAASG
jgi:hypothetical protein